MDNVVDTLVIKITGEGTSAIQTLENVAQSIERIDKAAGGLQGITTLTENLKKLRSVFNNLGKGRGSEALTQFSANIQQIAADIGKIDLARLEHLAEVMRAINTSRARRAAISDIAEAGKVTNAPTTAPELGGSTTAEVEEQTNAVNENAAAWARAGAEQRNAGNASKGAANNLKQVTKSIKSVSIAAKLSQSKLAQFLSSIKRIAMYRAIRSALMAITKAFREGIQHVYEYSQAISGTFAASMDRLATSGLYLKNSLGAMVSPLINALAPAIDFLIDKFVDLLNMINRVFAVLSGAKTWTKAIKYPKAYGDAAKSASGSMKELKATILGIDELNLLNGLPNSGGGGGASGEDYSKMFEDVELDNSGLLDSVKEGLAGLKGVFEGFVEGLNFDSIREKFETTVASIRGRVENLLERIDFSEMWESAKEFGRSIGDFFNSVVESVMSVVDSVSKVFHALFDESIVVLIEQYLPTLTDSVSSVVGFFSQLAKSVADIFGSAADSYSEMEANGKIISGGLETITAFLKPIKDLADDATEGLKITTKAVVDLFGKLKKPISWISSKVTPVLEKIKKKTGPILDDLGEFVGIAPLMTNPLTMGLGIILGVFAAIKKATEAIKNIVPRIQDAWKAVKQFFGNVGQFFKDVWNSVTSVWSGAGEWFSKNVIKPISGFFSDLWDGISETASACWESIVQFFSPAVNWFSQLFGSIRQTASDVFHNIGVIASGCWDIIKTAWGVAFSWFNEKVIQPVATFFKSAWSAISSAGAEAWRAIKSAFSEMFRWFDEKIFQPIGSFFSSMWDKIKTGAAKAWEGIKGVFGSVASFFKDIFSKAWQGVVNVFSIGGRIFTEIKDAIVTSFKYVVNRLIDGLNWVIAKPFNAINTALDKIRSVNIFGKTPFSNLARISVPVIPYLAEGGILDAGQMFIARESGPELVGNVGNRTGVMNNDQIVQAVSQGVYDANAEQNALLREEIGILRQILTATASGGDGGGNISSSDILTALDRMNRRAGRTLVPIG